MNPLALLFLIIAAALEVGGDALIRKGLPTTHITLLLAGAATLTLYGFFVNLTKLDFSRLMGIYIAIFFLIAQLTAVLIFQEKLTRPVTLGGLLIITGGLLMTFWK